jgi:hypothetical protein
MNNLTRDEHRADVRKTSWERFAEHEVAVIVDAERVQVYRCAQPRTMVHHFYVSFLPGAIVVHGDIGDMMLNRPSGGRGWLLGAVESMDYVLGKGYKIEKTEFLGGEAQAILDGRDDAGYEPETLARLREAWADRTRFEEGDGRAWAEVAYEVAGDIDFPRCLDYDYETLWCYEALRWLAAHLRGDGAEKGKTATA